MRKLQSLLAIALTLSFPLEQGVMPAAIQSSKAQARAGTQTPIQHVIVIIGENRSFDHVFGAYKPRGKQTVLNLLSRGIINEDGSPGINFAVAGQNKAIDTVTYSVSPRQTGPYITLPAVNTDGAPTAPSDTNPPPFLTLDAAKAAEPGLPSYDYVLLTTGATGLPHRVIDKRFPTSFPNGPYQITHYIPYDAYAGSPVHRFYQMWQQSDCNVAYATPENPSGCLSDLYPWVEDTVGAGSNGHPRPKPFNDQTTGEGSIAMGFYNVQAGDMPYFNALARNYTISDNYHQAVMGGTGANHIMMGTGDALWFSDGQGHPATPPSNEIENPNPQPGTNNWYTQDGYSGGSYSNCSDRSQPGVGPLRAYLDSLPYQVFNNGNCAPDTYYLLNNYAPGYFGDGTVNTGAFVLPPSSVRTIGDALLERNISWRYYGEGWNLYLQDPHYNNPLNQYCDICNFEQYVTSVMTHEQVRSEHLKDVTDLYADIKNGTLPAVSFVKPDGFVDGHPASSKFDLFEGFTQKIVGMVQANPRLWASTAIFITVDESGGYYDSGYIQPIDFFGDGPRIPLIVVSPFSRGGRIVHSYADHVSILKFIEKNWNLPPLTERSRDNLPNPIATADNPYVPTNPPAISDLMDMFVFHPNGDAGGEP